MYTMTVGGSDSSNIFVSSIVVSSGSTTSVVNGNTLQMNATILPTNASNSNVSWSVTNGTGSATIDSSGLLTATGVGTVTVTASAADESGVTGTEQITIATPTCPTISNAATYNAYPTCGAASCNSGYELSGGSCVAGTCPTISNAATYNAYPTCGAASCNSGYELSGGSCVAGTCPTISNAATYNAYPTCGVATCQTGYALTNGNCVASGGGGGSIPPQWLQPPTAPVGGFNILINNGATSTANPAVTLNLQAGSDTARMALSNFSDFRDAGQENYSATEPWNLCWTESMFQTPLTCPAGTYTVYAKFYTQYGQSSAPISASIVLRGNSLDGPTQTTSGFTFTKRLQLGMNMMDVKYLQIILNSDKDTQIAISGVGSPGHETTRCLDLRHIKP